MRDGAKFCVGSLAGAALTAAGFLLLGRPAATPVGDPAYGGNATSADAPDSVAPLPGGVDAPRPGLSVGQAPPSADEAAFLEAALREERRRRSEAVVRPEDTGIDVLRRFHAERADVSGLLADFDAFASHVRHAEGKTVAWKGGEGVTKVSLDEADGAIVLEFGPGTFLLEGGRRGWGDLREDVTAVEIRGAGMDATTVRLGSKLIFARRGLRSLRMSGLTLESVSDSARFLDARGDVAVVCEDVRFRRDPTQGSDPFYLEGYSYLGFRRCEFDGAGKGNAVRLRGDVVALFEECAFLDLQDVIYADLGTVREGVVRFEACEFEGSRLVHDWGFLYRGKPPFVLAVRGGRVAFGEPSLSAERRRTDWGASFTTAVDGTAFGPDPALSTVGDLTRVLASAASQAGRVPMEIRLKTTGRRGKAAAYEVVAWDRAAKKAVVLLATSDAAGVRVEVQRSGGNGQVHEALVASSRPLLEILEAARVPHDAVARGAHFYEWYVAEKQVPVVHLVSEAWPGWMIDAPPR